MNTTIFIRTYQGDWKWLAYCLQSLRKFAAGQKEIVVVAPPEDYKKLRQSVDFRKVEFSVCQKHHTDDYIGQQITKLMADTFCPGADHILFWDSDCLATRPFNVSEFFSKTTGLPLHTYRAWENAGTAACWRAITADVVGFDPRHEYMAQLPIIHARGTFDAFRGHIGRVHGCPMEELRYLGGVPALSEFNALGAFAHEYCWDRYEWREASGADGYPRPARQFWSRGDFTPAVEAEIHRILTQ